MAGKVMLAVAGAGKTYHICHKLIDGSCKNLVIAYTHENIKNLNRELINRFGKIPNNTFIMTFHSFIYRLLVRPYIVSICREYHSKLIKIRGVSLKDPPQKSIKTNKGYRRNPLYVNVTDVRHYINSKNECYCSLLSSLITHMRKQASEKIIQSFSKFFKHIYVDEFQDFRKEDYKLLMMLCNICPSVVMVGDYYQHSVSGTNNSGEPFVNEKKEVGYEQFIKEIEKQKLEIDTKTLSLSYRCSQEVCDFINIKLNIPISGNDKRQGKIIKLTMENPEQIKSILMDDRIVKLVYRNADKENFKCLNWSYSKGDTFDSVCIILTKNTAEILDDKIVNLNLPGVTRNKLYVALTRSSGNVYIVSQECVQSLKNLNFEYVE